MNVTVEFVGGPYDGRLEVMREACPELRVVSPSPPVFVSERDLHAPIPIRLTELRYRRRGPWVPCGPLRYDFEGYR